MLRQVGQSASRIAVVALAYFLAGWLSLHLEIPDGYATAVWPPAGIALAAAILSGPSVLPGVWIGALGVPLLLDVSPPAAISLATGATLQAAAGLWIARRIAGHGNPLNDGQSALRMILVGGPASCLVNASWGVATLVLVGRISPADAGFNWLAWWVGDAIGVLVFLPPILAWTAQPAEVWRRRRHVLAAPLLACFVVVVLFFFHARSIEVNRIYSDFKDRERPVGAAVLRAFERASDSVTAVANLFRASEEVRRDEFKKFASNTAGIGVGIRAMEWSERVDRGDRPKFEDRVRTTGLADFEIREAGPDGPLRRAGKRDRYYPVKYIEPASDNGRVLGFDLASDPARFDGIKQAIRTASPTVTVRVHPIQAGPESWSVLLLVPVYERGETPATAEERDRAVQGLVLGVLDVPALVLDAVDDLGPTGFVIRVRDLEAPVDEQLLAGPPPGPRTRYSEKHPWEGAGRPWEVEIAQAALPGRSYASWAVLAGGLLVTGLFGAFVLELATRQISVERLVALRTSELARANDELQRSNIELQRFAHVASHDLREPLRAIGSYAELLDESAQELDPEHRKFLERIVGAAKRMHELVDDLLALSRLEGSTAKMSSTPLGKLVGVALANLQPAIESAHARVEVAELPTVWCDPSPIVQVFQNLIANAVKFRRDSTAPVVRIGARRTGASWEFSVRDNGIGIAPEHHERVFEMFERLHPRERYGGTGIGLAVCRRIVDRHGGRIWVESPPEGGSVFKFTLRAEGNPG